MDKEAALFEGFTLETVKLAEATLRVRHGGRGSPLLLLHGHPGTHTTWYQVAPVLAQASQLTQLKVSGAFH